jgi:hypothetical protein
MALLLIGQCWVFNSLARDPHLLNAYPVLLALVIMVAVMFLAVRQRSHSSGGAGHGELRRFGWSVLWPASLAFAPFVAALSAVRFGPGHFFLVLFAFAAALATTLVAGIASVELAAVIFTRATISSASNGAA